MTSDWLSELAPATIDVVIELPGNRKHTLTIGTLSHAEWEEAGAEIKSPKVPHTKMVEGSDKLLPNPEDAVYLRDLRLSYDRRTAYRVARHFEKAGKVVPGGNALEKADAILKMDEGIYSALVKVIVQLSEGNRQIVENAADSFRGE